MKNALRFLYSVNEDTAESSPTGTELVVGAANHSVYAIDVTDPRKRHIEMYGKKCGHSDWVSGVAHLADGRVVSCGMDSKICLWAHDKKTATDIHAHNGSISKIASDARYNLAVSCGYDKAISLWKFPEARGRPGPLKGPAMTLRGHENPVLEFFFNDGILGSGARDGTVCFWDLETGRLINRHRAHAGPISFVDSLEGEDSLFISAGGDGCVKLWDHREKTYVCSSNPHGTSNVTGLTQTSGGGSGGGHIVSGGADNAVVILDPRRNLGEVHRFVHAKNSIYSMCAVGDGCVFAGDGSGMVYCYDTIGHSGEIGLKYGVGASGQGAVRCILPVGGRKVVAAGEDGKILVFSY